MGLFRRRAPGGPVPLEFRFFDEREWRAFNRLLVKRMVRAGLTGHVEHPGVLVVDGGERLSLVSLAQACKSAPPRRWGVLVDAHLVHLQPGRGDALQAEDARRCLKVRLVPDELAPAVAEPFAHGVVAGLVVDLPQTVVGVTIAQLASWGLPAADAWRQAWANVAAEAAPEEVERLAFGGAEVVSVYGDSFFTASKVAFLPDVVGPVGPDGALVAIPRRHTILAHLLGDGPAGEVVGPLVLNTRRLHVDGPGSVSPHLYWWKDGELRWVPASVDDDARIELYPPAELAPLL
jgi:hypothetical protein